MSDYHITIMTKRTAERHARSTHNIPDSEGLGWRPYTILVQAHGCIACTAFHRARDLSRWLRDKGLTLTLYRRPGVGLATGWAK